MDRKFLFETVDVSLHFARQPLCYHTHQLSCYYFEASHSTIQISKINIPYTIWICYMKILLVGSRSVHNPVRIGHQCSSHCYVTSMKGFTNEALYFCCIFVLWCFSLFSDTFNIHSYVFYI